MTYSLNCSGEAIAAIRADLHAAGVGFITENGGGPDFARRVAKCGLARKPGEMVPFPPAW